MRLTSNADQTKVTTSKRQTTGMDATVRSMPPSAGPTKIARLSIVLVVPLLAVSSSGESTRLGSRAATAGRKGVATTAVRAASAKMIAGGASFQMSTALMAMMEPRVMSQPIMIILRE